MHSVHVIESMSALDAVSKLPMPQSVKVTHARVHASLYKKRDKPDTLFQQ
jgi:hypothetical protein